MIPNRAETYNDRLADLVAAGSAGLTLDRVGIGTAIHFGLHGLATITDSGRPPQRAVATVKARDAVRRAQWM